MDKGLYPILDLPWAGKMIVGADGWLDILHSDLEITAWHYAKISDSILNREERLNY